MFGRIALILALLSPSLAVADDLEFKVSPESHLFEEPTPGTHQVDVAIPSGDTYSFHEATTVRVDGVLLAQADTGSATATSSPSTSSSGSAAATGSATEQPAPAKHICTLDGKEVECEQLADHPAQSASEVTKLWKDGAVTASIIFALFVILSWASKHIEWLETGSRAAYTATALTFLTLLVEPASRGTTPTLSMILSAAGGAALFFMNAKKPPKTAAPTIS